MSPRRDLLALGHAHSQATFNRSTVARYPRSTFISIRRDEPPGAWLGQRPAAAGPNALTPATSHGRARTATRRSSSGRSIARIGQRRRVVKS